MLGYQARLGWPAVAVREKDQGRNAPRLANEPRVSTVIKTIAILYSWLCATTSNTSAIQLLFRPLRTLPLTGHSAQPSLCLYFLWTSVQVQPDGGAKPGKSAQ
jgi:hypothetical protein